MSQDAEQLKKEWATHERWKGVLRPYSAEEVLRLRGSNRVVYTLAENGSWNLWNLLHKIPYVLTYGATMGVQAMQMAKAGLQAVYYGGWNAAAMTNQSHEILPDQSLYASNTGPVNVTDINNGFERLDQMNPEDFQEKAKKPDWWKGSHWFLPVVADLEAGFGGILNTHRSVIQHIKAGAAAVHLEDQDAISKKCGHMIGKVLIPTKLFVRKLIAARLAADVAGVPIVLIARTDAEAATLLFSDGDDYDRPFLKIQDGKPIRTHEGLFEVNGGLEAAIARALAYAPYSDVLWFETKSANLEEAKKFADAVHAKFPGKMLAYNMSGNFDWSKLDESYVAKFNSEMGKLGYKFQFNTTAGYWLTAFSALYYALHLASAGSMAAFRQFQEFVHKAEKEFGFTFRPQRDVSATYHDEVNIAITGGKSSTLAMSDRSGRKATESQFDEKHPPKN